MFAYDCKNCKQFTILGYVNELGEHFCSKECYKEYCEKNNYKPNLDKLIEIKGAE